MHKGDTIPGVLVTVFGLLFAIGTLIAPNLTLSAQTSDGVPGAGFFPFLLGSVVTIFGIALVVRGLRQKGSVQYITLDEEVKKNLKVLAFTVLGLLVFFVFWQLTHLFTVGILALSLFMNRLFERTWKFTLIYSSAFTAFIFLVFSVGFSIQFGM